MKQIIFSLFVFMSFATPLDSSVVIVTVVDHQPAVMMYNVRRTVLMYGHALVTPCLGSC